jgi:hypothetical protein
MLCGMQVMASCGAAVAEQAAESPALQARLAAARIARSQGHADHAAAVALADCERKRALHLAQHLRLHASLPEHSSFDMSRYPRPPKGSQREAHIQQLNTGIARRVFDVLDLKLSEAMSSQTLHATRHVHNILQEPQ